MTTGTTDLAVNICKKGNKSLNKNSLYIYRALLHKAKLYCRCDIEDYNTASVYYTAAIVFFENNIYDDTQEDMLSEITGVYSRLLEICFVRGKEDYMLAIKYIKRFWLRYGKSKQVKFNVNSFALSWLVCIQQIIPDLPQILKCEIDVIKREIKHYEYCKN
jgi:hypothetical protein